MAVRPSPTQPAPRSTTTMVLQVHMDHITTPTCCSMGTTQDPTRHVSTLTRKRIPANMRLSSVWVQLQFLSSLCRRRNTFRHTWATFANTRCRPDRRPPLIHRTTTSLPAFLTTSSRTVPTASQSVIHSHRGAAPSEAPAVLLVVCWQLQQTSLLAHPNHHRRLTPLPPTMAHLRRLPLRHHHRRRPSSV